MRVKSLIVIRKLKVKAGPDAPFCTTFVCAFLGYNENLNFWAVQTLRFAQPFACAVLGRNVNVGILQQIWLVDFVFSRLKLI